MHCKLIALRIHMSLYDDYDVKSAAAEKVQGWSASIKLLQSQLQLKKATVTQPKREQLRKVSLAPVIDLKSKRDEDDIYGFSKNTPKTKVETKVPIIGSSSAYSSEYDWNVVDEYDPLWPNEYEKVVKEMREARDRDRDRGEKDEKRKERKRKSRFSDPEESMSPPPISVTTQQISQPPLASGFAGKFHDIVKSETSFISIY